MPAKGRPPLVSQAVLKVVMAMPFYRATCALADLWLAQTAPILHACSRKHANRHEELRAHVQKDAA